MKAAIYFLWFVVLLLIVVTMGPGSSNEVDPCAAPASDFWEGLCA